jgi:hypothetical protein
MLSVGLAVRNKFMALADKGSHKFRAVLIDSGIQQDAKWLSILFKKIK